MTDISDKTCPICGGRKSAAKVTFSVDRDGTLIVVREVTATVCEQCGEEWIDDDIAQRLERIVEDAQAKNAQIEIVTL